MVLSSCSHSCCTFTATFSPSNRYASCTCAIDAELIGFSSNPFYKKSTDENIGKLLAGTTLKDMFDFFEATSRCTFVHYSKRIAVFLRQQNLKLHKQVLTVAINCPNLMYRPVFFLNASNMILEHFSCLVCQSSPEN